MKRDDVERVHSISTLPRSRREDQQQRMTGYIIAMTIRTVCFLLAGLFVTLVPWAPGAWICIALAIALPYPAVVLANRRDLRTNVVDHEPVVRGMLTASGPDTASRPMADDEPEEELPPLPPRSSFWVG